MAYKRKDGIYEASFSIAGKRYRVYGKTRQECRTKEAQKRQEIAKGLNSSGKNQTVRKYLADWIETKRDTVRESTLRSNTVLGKLACEAVIDKAGTKFGDLKLKDVEAQHIRDLQTALRGQVYTRTINDTVSMFRGMFRAAMNDRILTWNPAAGVKSLKRTEPAARDTTHRALTREETAAFMAAADKSWYRDLYTFLLNTGLRIGEAGALLPGDLRNGCANVNKTVTRTEVGGYMIGKETKTASGKRIVPLNKAASEAVERQKAINDAVFGLKVTDLSQPVFRSPQGNLLKSTNVNEDVKKICAAAGIEKFAAHAFRATFATRCVESGMQPKILQDLMGHADINMTMNLYAHSMEAARAEQLKVVNFS